MVCVYEYIKCIYLEVELSYEMKVILCIQTGGLWKLVVFFTTLELLLLCKEFHATSHMHKLFLHSSTFNPEAF